jgi:hypothetical protein
MTEMTLRDHFAASALTAIIERHELTAEGELSGENETNPKDTTAGWYEPDRWTDVAAAAYALADAMITERARRDAQENDQHK